MQLYAIIAAVWLASLAATNLWTAQHFEEAGVALEKQNTQEIINLARAASDKQLTDERAAAARTGKAFESQRTGIDAVFQKLNDEATREALLQANPDPIVCELPASRLRRWNEANYGAITTAPTPSQPTPAPAPFALSTERAVSRAGNQPQTSSQDVPRAGGTGLRLTRLLERALHPSPLTLPTQEQINMANDIADRAADTVARHADEGLYQASKAMSQKGCADCKDCEEPIAHARRLAVPSAQRCTECQGMHEMRTKQAPRRRT